MCVPAEATLNAEAAHGLVARNHVFCIAGKKVAVVRKAVGERRAVVENELFSSRALVNRGLESVIALPKSQNTLFNLWEAWARVYTVACGRGRVVALGIHSKAF